MIFHCIHPQLINLSYLLEIFLAIQKLKWNNFFSYQKLPQQIFSHRIVAFNDVVHNHWNFITTSHHRWGKFNIIILGETFLLIGIIVNSSVTTTFIMEMTERSRIVNYIISGHSPMIICCLLITKKKVNKKKEILEMWEKNILCSLRNDAII